MISNQSVHRIIHQLVYVNSHQRLQERGQLLFFCESQVEWAKVG